MSNFRKTFCGVLLDIINLLFSGFACLLTVCFQSSEIAQKVFPAFDNIFNVYLMRGFQNYEINWILMMSFWATCKIAQPIQPIWQHIFALPWSALKKPQWEFNFIHIFGIPSSSRHEKCCQMLERLFVLFHYSRKIPCTVKV